MGVVEATGIDQTLSSPAMFEDPYPIYRDLRSTDPVHWSDAWGVWVLTRYHDIAAILRDPVRFSSAGRYAALLDQLPATAQGDVETVRRHYSIGLIQSDPPDHTRQRLAVRDAFTPKVIAQLRPHVQARVDDLIDRLVGRAEFDLVADFAYPLPISVICDIMGIQADDHGRFRAWTRDIAGLQATGAAREERARATAAALEAIEGYFWRLCAERRRSPAGDLMSTLIAAQAAGAMTEYELISMCIAIVTAGHETTKGLILNTVATLLGDPGAIEGALTAPGGWASVIEESLRFESPIQRGWRRVTQDLEIRGRSIRAGQLVYLMLGSANRDPDAFADPDTFEVRRADNRHVAFGYGVHFCVGAPLARLEGAVALETLLRRARGLHLAGDPSRTPSIHVRGFISLPLAADAILPRTTVDS